MLFCNTLLFLYFYNEFEGCYIFYGIIVIAYIIYDFVQFYLFIYFDLN